MLTFDAAIHTYTWDGEPVPLVTQILRPISGYDGVPEDVLAFAAERGTAIHEATELDDANDLDEASIDPQIAGYVEAWRAFRRESRFMPIASEGRVFHPDNRYAGTFDALGVLNGRLTIVEKKATARLMPATGPQVAAYMMAYNALRENRVHVHGIGLERPLARQCIAVQLRKDDTYRIHDYTPDYNEHVALFRALVTLARWEARFNS